MKTIIVVAVIAVPLLALTMIQESPEKSLARSDFFFQWCMDNAPKKDLTQQGICGRASTRLKNKEITLDPDLESQFKAYWDKAQKEFN
jgi:hypothetical protein